MIRQYIKLPYLLIFSLISVMLSGCFTYFEPDLKSTPVVCINSLITAGEKIKVEVTRTWRYAEGNPNVDLDISLKNAEVYLYVNDELEEKLKLRSHSEDNLDNSIAGSYNGVDNYYAAKYIPKCGDRIKLYAKDKTYGDAIAEVTIPYPVNIDGYETLITNKKSSFDKEKEIFYSSFEMILKITLTDPASVSNYYIFDMQTYKTVLYEPDGDFAVPPAESVRLNPDYSFDPIFSEHITPLETIITDAYGRYTVFSDRQISGKPYTLEIPLSGSYWCDYKNHPELDNKLSIDVNVGHISSDYYKYMLSLWAATEGVSGALGGVGLGDAVFEYSNVTTGAGIVAAKANSTVKLNMHDILVSH